MRRPERFPLRRKRSSLHAPKRVAKDPRTGRPSCSSPLPVAVEGVTGYPCESWEVPPVSGVLTTLTDSAREGQDSLK